jgi:site-specific recombinase XerD
MAFVGESSGGNWHKRVQERGIDLKAIAEIAGHTSIRTTTMYIESNPKRLARILQEVTF